MSRSSVGRAVAVGLALAIAGAACGGGGSSKSKGEASAQAPEDQRAPAAQVTVGLGKIGGTVGQVGLAAGTDAKSAKELNEGIEPEWQKIEGTIRANDKDLYIRAVKASLDTYSRTGIVSTEATVMKNTTATHAATPNIDVRLQTEVVGGGGSGRLEWLEIRDNALATVETSEASGLFILAGQLIAIAWIVLPALAFGGSRKMANPEKTRSHSSLIAAVP